MNDRIDISQQAASPRTLEQFERRYHQVYTVESQCYDQTRFGHHSGQAFNASEQAMIWELLDARPGQTVLDVASGTGRIAAYLAGRGLGVVACDLTPNMLRKAQARAEAAALDTLRCVSANGRMLPFADEQFDAVISIRFLHLFPVAFYSAFVQEMWRVLRPGGTLLIQFESALAGGGAVWGRELYRRVVRGHKPRYYLWPHEIPQVFERIEPRSLHGFSPFGGRLIQLFHAGSAARLEAFLAGGKQSVLANHLFVRAIKPGSSAP